MICRADPQVPPISCASRSGFEHIKLKLLPIGQHHLPMSVLILFRIRLQELNREHFEGRY